VGVAEAVVVGCGMVVGVNVAVAVAKIAGVAGTVVGADVVIGEHALRAHIKHTLEQRTSPCFILFLLPQKQNKNAFVRILRAKASSPDH